MNKTIAVHYVRYVVLFTHLGLVAGCANTGIKSSAPGTPEQRHCESVFIDNDKLISAAGVADAQYARIKAFPYLRVNRLYAALKTRLTDEASRVAWITELGALDHLARSIENSNLPLTSALKKPDDNTLTRCRELLISNAVQDEGVFERLYTAAAVPDNYRWQQRLLGFYPFSRWPVYLGVKRLQENESPQLAFKAAANTLHYVGEGNSNFEPPPPSQALGFPQLNAATLIKLLNRYEPIWSIHTTSTSDHIGAMNWADSKINIKPNQPTVYQDISYAIFENQLLLQLNYTIWFPAVEARKAIDIYAGEIDGLTFRVTLDSTQSPLYVDVMHNCGCYYMGFPAGTLERIKQTPSTTTEPLWIPHSLPPLSNQQKYQLHVDSGNHFVRALTASEAPNNLTQLERQPYRALRALPWQQEQTRSAFSPRGLIENSARLERLILWPMGVISAGAMRQTGNHAIAFVGKRHFDDPNLIGAHFRRSRKTDEPK